MRRLMVGLVGVVLLVVGFYGIENLRGTMAWNTYAAELRARGEPTSWKEMRKVEVPDALNLVNIPYFSSVNYTSATVRSNTDIFKLPDGYFKKIGNHAKGTLTDMEGVASTFTNASMDAFFAERDSSAEDLFSAIRRPGALFWGREKGPFEDVEPDLPHVMHLGRYLSLRAIASVHKGDKVSALATMEDCVLTGHALREEVVLIFGLARSAMYGLVVQPVWEGLALHLWSTNDLLQIEKMMSEVQPLLQFQATLKCERYFGFEIADKIVAGSRWREVIGCDIKDPYFLIPTGWIMQNKVHLGRMIDEVVEHAISTNPILLKLDWLDQFGKSTVGRKSPYNFFADIVAVNWSKFAIQAAAHQVGRDQLVLACALERWRMAHGALPEKLEQLVPDYSSAIPFDVMDGQPMRYKRIGDDKFVLYSIGSNLTDDNGVSSAEGRATDREGDWCWPSWAGESTAK